MGDPSSAGCDLVRSHLIVLLMNKFKEIQHKAIKNQGRTTILVHRLTSLLMK